MFASKNLLWRSGILLLLLLGAISCRTTVPALPARPSPAPGTPASGPVNLTLWHSETGAARQELEALARDFHSANPDVTVTPVYVGSSDDLEKQVMAAIALSRTPDLILAPRRDLAQFARQDGLLSLNSLRDDPALGLKAADKADFLPGLLDEGTFVEFNKQLYAFPFDLEGLVLFYNQSLISQPPATWTAFSDMASKATKDQQYGWAMNVDADVFSAMLVSQGSAMIDDPERRTLFAERGGVNAMTMAAQLIKSGAAEFTPDSASAIQDFAGGQAAFYFDWMSQLPSLQQAQQQAGTTFQIGLASLPQTDPTSPFILVRGNDLAILRMPPDRARDAWFFIRWITASQQTARWARAANAIPLRASALSFLSGDVEANARLRQIANSFDGAIPEFVPLSANRHAPQIENLMEGAWYQIAANNKADIPDILAAATSSADQLLAENR